MLSFLGRFICSASILYCANKQATCHMGSIPEFRARGAGVHYFWALRAPMPRAPDSLGSCCEKRLAHGSRSKVVGKTQHWQPAAK